jgi:hypothetical protein
VAAHRPVSEEARLSDLSAMGGQEGGLTNSEGLAFRITQSPDPGCGLCDHANFYQEVMTLGNSPDSPSDPATSYSKRRMVPRYSFIATTELTDSASAMQLSGRVTEISRKGCYVDILNALPVGTSLNVRISRDQGTFVTKGKIIYVHEGIGMGVAFLDPPKDQLQILDSWLAELRSAAAL